MFHQTSSSGGTRFINIFLASQDPAVTNPPRYAPMKHYVVLACDTNTQPPNEAKKIVDQLGNSNIMIVGGQYTS